jgi:hypothetical protein
MTDSGTTFKGVEVQDETYKMELRSDGDSSIDV